MAQGPLIAQRFEILAEAGSGGMGTVYRARDHHTGLVVAVKLVSAHSTTHSEVERFGREARVLSELRHPGIVSYIAHGHTADGSLYLAMEWLEGEDLCHRLLRGPLTVDESLRLLRGVADALSFAHRRGIVHRDLKPGNLFLRGGEVERVMLLDFGIARRRKNTHNMTRTGSLVGTPEYMAPEQARGERNIGPTTDVFSLACVIYECLTGRPPFVADHLAAQLAKILFEEPRPIDELVRDLPPALTTLLGRMLRKDPAERPASASEVHSAICDLLDHLDSGCNPVAVALPAPHRLTASEQELVTIVIASPRDDQPHPQMPEPGPGLPTAPNPYQAELADELSHFGMRAEWLSDGSLVATLSRAGNATDQAAQAARAALELHERWPEAAVALATGRGVMNSRLPVGDVIDRVARLLGQMLTSADADAILVDEVSAALLDSRFALSPALTPGLQAHRLEREKSISSDDTRTLLGRPTPCVGREPELGMLEALLTGCRDEAAAGAVLIKAQQGMGKSRLWHEFIRRLRTRGEDVEIWTGRGDAMDTASPYGILAHALRGLCQVHTGEPLDDQQRKLSERLGRNLEPSARRRVVEFLGELCSVPFPDQDSPELRLVRSDLKAMNRAIGVAFIDLLKAECAQRPLVLVLDDLQWSDTLSVSLLSNALRELADQPLLVLGLARPEVTTVFPQLWADKVQEISLSGLSRKASERLVHEVLGKQVEPAVVARIVAQAAGNVLYLEELIRAQAVGRGDQLPETILAMLQSRLSYLEPGARRLLRAASVFGETFWRGGVRVLLRGSGPSDRQPEADGEAPTQPGGQPGGQAGPDVTPKPTSARWADSNPPASAASKPNGASSGPEEGGEDESSREATVAPDTEIDSWLAILCEAEIIERHRESRFPSDIEYAFRHGLLREATYSLLTSANVKIGHVLAARFLESVGEQDPLVIADHYRLSRDPERAAGA